MARYDDKINQLLGDYMVAERNRNPRNTGGVPDERKGAEQHFDKDEPQDEDAEETANQKTYGGNKGDDPRHFDRKTGRKTQDKDYEGEEEEENFNYFGEEIEAEILGTPLVNQKEGNPTPVTGSANVVHSQYTSKVGSKEGDGKSGIKLDPEGTDEGTPLVNQKKGNAMSVKGKSNVVKSKIKGGGKGDQEFFQKNS